MTASARDLAGTSVVAEDAVAIDGDARPAGSTLTPTPLRELVDRARAERTLLLTPGAYDALSARLIVAAGFPAVYVTGAGFANSHFGLPDVGFVGLSELCDHVAAISDVVSVPLVVDADTGFGNAVSVARTVHSLERAGASAIQLEDQVAPKRCGHFSGKEVVSVDEMAMKIRAAVDHRASPDTLIIARTDARAEEGLASAIDRAARYHAEGADILFVEAPTSVEELEQIGRQLDAPLIANMVEGGSTPIVAREDLASMGFTIALYANSALRAAQYNVSQMLRSLREDGTTNSVVGSMATWLERQHAVGKDRYDEMEERYRHE